MTKKIKDLHDELLVLLKDIDRICTNNNIKYSLFAGTLIGAVRHQGFIPWDDDADVVFEREEYEKFIRVLPSEFEIVKELWVPHFKNKSKDIFVDVFVFDNISDVPSKQKKQILKLKFLQGTLKKKLTLSKGGIPGKFLSALTYMIGLPFGQKAKQEKYDAVARQLRNENTAYVFSSLDQFKYISHILPKAIFNSYKKIRFEDTELMVMDNYHEYLTKFYGDYMKLPDEDKRIPEHGSTKE